MSMAAILDIKKVILCYFRTVAAISTTFDSKVGPIIYYQLVSRNMTKTNLAAVSFIISTKCCNIRMIEAIYTNFDCKANPVIRSIRQFFQKPRW